MENKLLQPLKLGNYTLKNRVFMAPMTRNRATRPGDLPNDTIATYYQQRASAGLIITEATHVSPSGVGYIGVPGIWNTDQVEAWKKVTAGVHAQGGRIFMQIFHAGRMSHPYFLQGAAPFAPSAVAANWTVGILDYHENLIQVPAGTPKAMLSEDIEQVKAEFLRAADHAFLAGFDGVEVHGANGYLLEQFLNPHLNLREDAYGGSIQNRSRLLLEITQAIAEKHGKGKVGVRFSPFGKLHDQVAYSEALVRDTYYYLAETLQELDITYLHLFNQGAFGTAEVPVDFFPAMRAKFRNTLIINGGYSISTGEAAIEAQTADAIAFGRYFISNPDLPARIAQGKDLAELDTATFYTGGARGYIDYPALSR